MNSPKSRGPKKQVRTTALLLVSGQEELPLSTRVRHELQTMGTPNRTPKNANRGERLFSPWGFGWRGTLSRFAGSAACPRIRLKKPRTYTTGPRYILQPPRGVKMLPEGVNALWLRIKALFRRPQFDRDLNDELQFHLAMREQKLMDQGLPAGEASYVARRQFGNTIGAKEMDREMWTFPFLETLWQDIRYGLRQLRRSPGFTIVAVLTLSLGIGANTAIFWVADAALLKPLRYRNPAALTIVWEDQPTYNLLRNTVAPPNFFRWEQQNHCFSGMAAFLDQPVNLTGTGEPQQVDVQLVSPNFFSLLGVDPMLGRAFSPGEDQPGKNHVAVLSYGLWKSKFGGDPNILGKAIELDGESFAVIGIARSDFDFYISEFSRTGERPQLWAPLETTPVWHDWTKVGRFLRVIARVKPGLSLAQAQAQMSVVAANLAAHYPTYDKGWGIRLVSLRDQLSGALRPALLILLGAVAFVLLIACANISSLLLSRAAGRRREIALRIALGASRRRIVQQLLTESLVLGVLGGALGAFVAIWATEALIRGGSATLLDLSAISVDWRILAFAAGVTLLAGVLAGFLPSFVTASFEVASALPEGGRTSSAGRKSLSARSILVVVEISLALVLLAGSGLLIQSFFRLTEVDPGFNASHLLTFQISLPDKYQHARASAAFFNQLLGKIRALPGAISTSADVTPPFSGVGSATYFSIVGEPPLPVGEARGTEVRVIEPDYFRTMGIPLLRGRTFNDREFARQSNVVIINDKFADKYFLGKNPLGQKIVIDMKDKNLPDRIIGVVGNVHESSLARAPDPLAYWPYPELPYNGMTVVVRTATPPLSLVPSIRRALHQIDKDQPMAKISTMDQLVANSAARSRFTVLLLSTFAALALALACIGIYGVMAYSVAQRTHEIGIRLALGAQNPDVLRMVLGKGLRLALVGWATGLVGALVLTRLLSSLLYDVKPTDPSTFLAVSVILIVVALLACYIPARRAANVDPTEALRYQ
jgi:predicted permease